jgi:alpha-glucosidase
MLRSHGICALAALLLAHPSFAQSVSGDAFVPPTPVQLRAAATPTIDATWWKHAVIYEIYPRSFQDSNGDGIGDLNGITQRLDYLQKLGIDAIWIAPMYPSPQVDFGYDISNYEAVDPQYGTLADFDHMLAAAKAKNIRIVLDMVLNHTSDQHPWFVESASSRTNPRADWYVWSDGVSATSPKVTAYQRRFIAQSAHGPVVPPNNWISLFGGSAWEWVPARQQFYYHKFYKQQPDLNWRNPAVEGAMFAAMRFWLDRGVAGFRLDAVPTLFEDAKLRDEPIAAPGTNPQGDPNVSDIYTNMLPEVHDVLRRMRKMIDTYPDNRVLIGETYLPNSAALDQWYGGAAHNELQLPMDMLVGFHREGGVNARNVALDLPHFRQTLTEMETELNGNWPLLVFDNHDNIRSWDRFGDGVHNAEIARVLATILLTTRSTALMYYGEELGMATHTPTRVEDVRDPIGITGWPREKGRDGERTPMQWSNAEVDAGFSTAAQTWLPIGADAATVNVATESADPHSLLNWYSTLIAMRRDKPALHDGGIVMLDTRNPSVLSYARTAAADSKPIIVSVNMTAQPQTINLDLAAAGIAAHGIKLLLADASPADLTCKDCGQPPMTVDLTLPPYASLVAEVQ